MTCSRPGGLGPMKRVKSAVTHFPVGHFLPEEAPEETLEGLLGFFR